MFEDIKCPICHKGCSLSEPNCGRGWRVREDYEWRMWLESSPKCPGCHIGCFVADPQCGRGLKFHDKWEAGEEIPERRMPGGPRPEGEKPKDGEKPKGLRPGGPMNMPPEEKTMFLLTGLLPRVLGDLEGDETDQILTWLERQEGAMTYEVMPERARVNEDTLYGNLEYLLEKGYIVDEMKPWGTRYYWITDAGRERSKQAQSDRKQAIADKFACYTDEEKEQLLQLLEKLLPFRR